MNCEIAKTLFMDFLYEELATAEVEALRAHMEHCEACRDELAGLQTARQALQILPQEEPAERLVFSDTAASAWTEWWRQAKALLPRPTWARAGLGFAMALMFFLVAASLANLQIKYSSEGLLVSMHLLPPKQEALPDGAADALLARMRVENMQMVSQLLAQERQEQQQQWQRSLAALARDLDRKRQNDLLLVGQGLEEIQRTTYRQVGQTNQALQQLIRYVNLPEK